MAPPGGRRNSRRQVSIFGELSHGHAPRDRDRPQEALPAVAPAVAVPAGGAVGPAGAEPWGGGLPADLTALSLAQFMNLPLRAPQTEPEAEPEVAEDGAEDGETVPAAAQTQAGRGSEEAEAPPPPAAAGAAFSAPDLDGDGEADPEGPVDSRGRGAPKGDDAREGNAPPGTVRFAALLASLRPFWTRTAMPARIRRRRSEPSGRPPAAGAPTP